MPPVVHCAICGALAESTLGWMSDRDSDGSVRWICPICSRDHVRAIEARLDRDWW